MSLKDIALDTLNDDEIESLIGLCNDELRKRKQGRRKSVTDQIRKLAKDNGFDLNDLIGNLLPQIPAPRQTKVGVRIKYRSPHNSEQTWTGRGKQPLWVAEWLSNGGKLEELLIP